MLRSTHAHSIRWTLGRLWQHMLGGFHLWIEVPPLWCFKILNNVLTSKQRYSWRLLRWELLVALVKDVQVEQELPVCSPAAASCWGDPADIEHTAQQNLKAMLGVQHSTVQLCACSCKLRCGSPAPLPKASGFPGRINTSTDLGVTSTCCLFFQKTNCIHSCICMHTWFILVPIFLFLCNATFVCCSWK